MKVTRFLISILFLGATASMSFAQGAVSINWNNCTGPIDKTPVPSLPGQKINISVIGHSAPHKAYDVRMLLGQPGGLRDAWRFDGAGCQGSPGLAINHIDAKTCPAFMGPSDAAHPSLQIKSYEYDATTGKARGLLANSYPNGNSASLANTRYLLASFNFDQTYGVAGASDPVAGTCGGLEVPLCAHITFATWLTMDGIETPWAIAGEYVTANDAANTQRCPGATPAQAKTWGSVKSQYRN